MKLSDSVLLMFLVAFFYLSLENCMFFGNKIENRCREMKDERNMLVFVSESFRNTCENKGFDSLENWQKSCRAMWNLSYIGFTFADSFMDYDFSDSKIVYGSWIYKDKNYEVYCRIK